MKNYTAQELKEICDNGECNKEIERAYCRECPEYRSKKEIYEKVLSEVKKEKK